MKTRAVASPSTAGLLPGGRALTKAGETLVSARSVKTLVHEWKLETCIGALLAAHRLAFIDQPDQIY